MTESTPEMIDAACEVMHDAYETAASTTGWETQERSRKPWADVPEANKATMRAAVAALLDWLAVDPQRQADTVPRGDLVRYLNTHLMAADVAVREMEWGSRADYLVDAIHAAGWDVRRLPDRSA